MSGREESGRERWRAGAPQPGGARRSSSDKDEDLGWRLREWTGPSGSTGRPRLRERMEAVAGASAPEVAWMKTAAVAGHPGGSGGRAHVSCGWMVGKTRNVMVVVGFADGNDAMERGANGRSSLSVGAAWISR